MQEVINNMALSVNWKRFLIVGCVHGDEQDIEANNEMLDFKTKWNPHFSVANGDILNCSPIRVKASKDERALSMRDDLKAALSWFERFKPTVFLRGNHDERIWDVSKANRGLESDYAKDSVDKIQGLMKKFKAPILPYNKRPNIGTFKIGKLSINHGFHTGPTSAIKQAEIYGDNAFAHVHTQLSAVAKNGCTGTAIGAMCSLDPEYARASPGSLSHVLGFAYGVVNMKTENYHIWLARKKDGRWMFPTDLVEH